ncbi:ISAs1-like element ISAnsp13 family transposase [Anaeromyxobacter sp. Fw109-5]|uniref:ISAs1-like element ISAnsp13 family transposase n=1 Tax=Anaeromyxobacter sp. (strain Fw109-5) TaxID=404589 RepID=UPI0000ED77C7|nr:ISAs1-like element ISAnsp13 family transposase [Anaeromyxobacter sp. Fw109-5]ABS24819.1 transposase IS4 family protein [Anaeromyxobacter sp. Fw109-5]
MRACGPHPQDGRTRANEKRPGGRRSCRSPKHKPGVPCGTPTSPGTGRSTTPERTRGSFTTTSVSWAAWPPRSPSGAGACAARRTSSRTSACALGLGRGKPCDTTLYRLLAEQSPAGLEETVFAQVKDLIARKVVRNDLLALGVVSFDGKGTWSRTDGEKVKGAQQSAYDAEGSSLQTFGALRAALTSSSVCPCVGQRLIGSKEGESTAFRRLLPAISEQLGGQFRIVTGDAGLCARENAELVTSLGRWYVFGLKDNQPYLHDIARDYGQYDLGTPLARTAERYRGHTIVRELYARDVAGNPAAAIEAAQQLWYVCQTTTDRRGEIVAVEQRYFVTSIPTGTLTRDQELALVRMHWAIENGCHWTMDVMLGEDEGHPCQASRASIETVSWLRLIGYNAVSAWRTLAPRKDGRPVAWARAMETLRDALLAAEVTDHRELASAVT